MILRLLLFLALIWYGFQFIVKLVAALLKEFGLSEPAEQVRRRPTGAEKTNDTGINKEYAEDAEYEDIV